MDWFVAIFLLVIGVFFIVMNWIIFYHNTFKGGHWSFVFFMGAVLTAIGLAGLPVKGTWRFWWLPFFLDFTCVPALIYGIFYWIRKRKT